MRLDINTLLNANNALGVLNNTRGMKAVVAYRISKMLKPIAKELKEYEEQRKRLCDEYANKDEHNNPIIVDNRYDVSEDNLKIIDEELENLRKETVEIDITKVSLEDIEPAKLSPAQLESIEFILNIEEE